MIAIREGSIEPDLYDELVEKAHKFKPLLEVGSKREEGYIACYSRSFLSKIPNKLRQSIQSKNQQLFDILTENQNGYVIRYDMDGPFIIVFELEDERTLFWDEEVGAQKNAAEAAS